MLKPFAYAFFLLTLLVISSCSDPNMVVDQNSPVNNRNWSYVNRIRYDVKIDDPSAAYNAYLNLRVTGDYKYSNLFVLISQTNLKGGKPWTTRFEFKLANKDGEWLGKGTGNLYSYQLPFKTNFKFPEKGTYRFEIEQNMRDNPLHEVSDVGLRIEKTAGK
ncbi:gliding motility lipoprotein GldH [Mucilaginibacter sp. RS28]|uniref:Gliding motility lipoprotein GldH n=1 Tax=Mucilaginibacter straminoryzae TaxID=2932774 RepID=A0A9X1X0A4_9SPHI|nr:gliding motility lipoprotein GldH [Mucilaginibacter straminoryzae]MCJ8208266.1 gliding motility lipoprotein GldH [Mucilaginibacter straminoryzae]